MHTVTAWTSPAAAEAAIARNPVHREGVDRVNNHGLNEQTRACPGCGTRVHLPAGAATATCACGGVVEVSSYF
jgi:hypothetical protein